MSCPTCRERLTQAVPVHAMNVTIKRVFEASFTEQEWTERTKQQHKYQNLVARRCRAEEAATVAAQAAARRMLVDRASDAGDLTTGVGNDSVLRRMIVSRISQIMLLQERAET